MLSGEPPLLAPDASVARRQSQENDEAGVPLRFPRHLLPPPSVPTPYGGLAISLGSSRRARINGLLVDGADTVDLVAEETFTVCRKYIAPSVPLAHEPRAGPVAREAMSFDDPWLWDLLSRAETSFLATISPAGGPDISHRGGPPGFLQLNSASRELTWQEYVGDGVFKSAVNLRATGRFTLLVPEVESGEGVEMVGRGNYTNMRGDRRQRLDLLVQHGEEFPVQGLIRMQTRRGVPPPRLNAAASQARSAPASGVRFVGSRAGASVIGAGPPAPAHCRLEQSLGSPIWPGACTPHYPGSRDTSAKARRKGSEPMPMTITAAADASVAAAAQRPSTGTGLARSPKYAGASTRA